MKLLYSLDTLAFRQANTMETTAAIPATIAIVFAVLASMAPHFSTATAESVRSSICSGGCSLLAVIITALVFWVATLAEFCAPDPVRSADVVARLAGRRHVVLGPSGAFRTARRSLLPARQQQRRLRN